MSAHYGGGGGIGGDTFVNIRIRRRFDLGAPLALPDFRTALQVRVQLKISEVGLTEKSSDADARDVPRALAQVSAGADGRLLVCCERKHCVHFLIPHAARMRRWRIVGRLAAALLALHARAVERLFAPGGAGFAQAAASFEAALQEIT